MTPTARPSSALWALTRRELARQLHAHDLFVRQLEHDPALSGDERRRRVRGARRARDQVRGKLTFVELCAIWCVPVPASVAKTVALAKHFDRSAATAARSGDLHAVRDWAKRRRAALADAMETWTAWNCCQAPETAKPAVAGSVSVSEIKIDDATLRGIA